MWHAVAPELAKRFTVICPDLRGYGGSLKPPATPDHAPYAKTAMARDMVEVMEHFGHRRFLIGGHDRGARVAHRLALDFPERVERLAVLDIVPTVEAFERADMDFALGYYHWFWFAQPHPFPEVLINAAPEVWFTAHTTRGPKPTSSSTPRRWPTISPPRAIPTRSAASARTTAPPPRIDLEHDRASRAAGIKIQCPLLVLWGAKGKIAKWYDTLAIWRQYCAAEMTGGPVNSGHYLAEEAPGEVLARFGAFFSSVNGVRPVASLKTERR